MANDFIRVGADSTGKRMDAESFDRAGTTIYRERVQVGGTSDADIVLPTTAAPDAAAFAIPVRVAGSAQVSGAVSVSAMPAVSGTVTVQGAVTIQTQLGTQVVSVVPGVSVTVQQGVSVSAQVSGTVSVVAPGSTTGSSGMSGLLVWLGASQTVSVVPGLSVSAVVSGTVTINGTVTALTGTVSISGVVVTTTATSGVGGPIVWLGVGQTLATVQTVATILGTQIVSVVPGLSVTIQQGASVSVAAVPTVQTLVTILSTVNVAIVAGAGGGGSVTTAVPSASATGQVMWIVGGQSTTAFPVVVTGTVTAGAGTTVISGTVTVNGSVALSGTGLVSVVPGVSVTIQQGASVSAVVSGTVTGIPADRTTAIPSASATGAVMWIAGGQSTTAFPVVVTGTVTAGAGTTVISGTVTVNGSVALSGTGLVSVVPGVSVTIQQGVSVSAVVSGTVTAIPLNQTTAVPSASATGQVMWIVGGQSTTAFPVVVTGTVTAGAGTTVVSGTVTVNGSVALSGTGLVSVVPGLSVSAVVSGTVTAVLAGTTAVPSASAAGGVMWIAGGQSTTAFPVVVTGTVTAGAGTTVVSVTGSVTVVAGLSVSAVVSGTVTNVPLYSTTATPAAAATGGIVWVANPGAAVATTVLTVQTILGTAVVSVVPGVSVTIAGLVFTTADQAAVSTALVVRGTVSILTGTAVVSGTVTVLGSVAISGTGLVSVVPGVSVTIQGGASVSAVVSGTVTVAGMVFTTVDQPVGSTGLVVRFGAGTVATVLTIVTVLGTQIVSNAPGQSVSIVGSVLTIVTQLGTQVVSVVPGLSVSAVVSGTVSNIGLLFTTGMATVASTGQVVVPKDFARQPVVIVISSTVVGSSTTMLMTVYTGATAVTTGASFWAVPAGRVFRIMNMNIVAVSSAVLGQARFVVIVGTAAASLSVVATVGIAAVLPFAIEASTAPFALGAYLADVVGATTVGVGIQGGTSCSILGAVVSGYLF